ncbi:MAG: phytanoyl-CoA dioxygenase family protein [Agriterribacter sp.]
MEKHKFAVSENGFTTITCVYTKEEVQYILSVIDKADKSNETFRKSNDVFAIRQFLKEIPDVIQLIFNDKLKHIITALFGNNYFAVKSIYFDKPENSNWYVPYHQDLTISVDKKISLEHFVPWTIKYNQFAVQPPLEYLENIFTIRIHLDDTDENNGALKVIPKSHLKGLYRLETINWSKEKEAICNVPEGGIMVMKPLLLHSSGRTINKQRRRVIHIEFADKELPETLQWSERTNILLLH